MKLVRHKPSKQTFYFEILSNGIWMFCISYIFFSGEDRFMPAGLARKGGSPIEVESSLFLV